MSNSLDDELYSFFKKQVKLSKIGLNSYKITTVKNEIKQYLSNKQNRAWHEIYSFLNNICDQLVNETNNTYANWSHSKYEIGKYIKKDYYKKTAYVFIGFYFTSLNSIELYVQTNSTFISDKFLDREDNSRIYNFTFWDSKKSSEKYLESKNIVNNCQKYVLKLDRWRGQK